MLVLGALIVIVVLVVWVTGTAIVIARRGSSVDLDRLEQGVKLSA